jgi:uncharacterized phage-like protein YoqJ
MKYNLDLDTAEGITKNVLKQHRKWARQRMKKYTKAMKQMDNKKAGHPDDYNHDLRLELAINVVLEYFGEA